MLSDSGSRGCMVARGRSSCSGQTTTEFVLILAAIALGCLVALIVFGGAVGDLFGTISHPSSPSPFVPPNPVDVPTTVDDCLGEGWRNYPQFADEAACIQFVNGGG